MECFGRSSKAFRDPVRVAAIIEPIIQRFGPTVRMNVKSNFVSELPILFNQGPVAVSDPCGAAVADSNLRIHPQRPAEMYRFYGRVFEFSSKFLQIIVCELEARPGPWIQAVDMSLVRLDVNVKDDGYLR